MGGTSARRVVSNQVPKTRSHKGHNLSESCPGRGTAQVCQDMHEPGPLDGEAGVVGRPGLMPYSWGPKGDRRPGPYDQIWELSGPTPYAAGVGASVCVCGVEGLTSPPSVWGQSQSACHLWQLCCRCVEGHGEEGIYQAANNHWATGLVAHNVRNLLNKRHGLIVHIENVGPSQWPAYSAGSAPSTLSDPCSSLSPIPIADHSSLASRVPCYAHLKAVPCSFLSVTHSHHSVATNLPQRTSLTSTPFSLLSQGL